MEVNISNIKQKEYEVGDIIELNGGVYLMIIQERNRNNYALMTLDGEVTTYIYSSIDELLEGYSIKEHYKKSELQIIRRKN